MLGALGHFGARLMTELSLLGSMIFGTPGESSVLLCNSDRIVTRTLGGTADCNVMIWTG